MIIEGEDERSEEEKSDSRIAMQRSESELKILSELSQIEAILSVYIEAADDCISEKLGLTADYLSLPEDTVSAGRFLLIPNDVFWQLSTAGKVNSVNPLSHLKWLLEQVHGKLPAIRELQADGAVFEVHLRLNSWINFNLIDIDVETLSLLARYKIKLMITMSYENTESEF